MSRCLDFTVQQLSTFSHLGDFARVRREKFGLTQAELAQRAQVSRAWIVKFERWHRTAELGRALQVLRALDVRSPPTAQPDPNDFD